MKPISFHKLGELNDSTSYKIHLYLMDMRRTFHMRSENIQSQLIGVFQRRQYPLVLENAVTSIAQFRTKIFTVVVKVVNVLSVCDWCNELFFTRHVRI